LKGERAQLVKRIEVIDQIIENENGTRS
jgi:hypothetical protein